MIVFLLLTLVVMTGYQFYRSLSGQNKPRTYTVDMIDPDMGSDVLDFLETKEKDIRVDPEEI